MLGSEILAMGARNMSDLFKANVAFSQQKSRALFVFHCRDLAGEILTKLLSLVRLVIWQLHAS